MPLPPPVTTATRPSRRGDVRVQRHRACLSPAPRDLFAMRGCSRAEVRMVTMSATYGSGGAVVAPRPGGASRASVRGPADPDRGSGGRSERGKGLTDEERQVRGRRLLDRLVMLAPGMNLPTPDASDLRDLFVTGWRRASGSWSTRVARLLGRGGARRCLPIIRVCSTCVWTGCWSDASSASARDETIDVETVRDRILRQTDDARSRYVQRLYGR